MATYELISTTTVSTPAYSFTLSSIPQTYTDLVLKISARSNYASAGHEMSIQTNSLTTGYANRMLYTNAPSTTASAAASNTYHTWAGGVVGANATANTFSNCEIYFPNYSSTALAKSISVDTTSENNGATGAMWINSGVNTSTAAITSLTVYCWQSFINYVANTTFTLYGIKNS